MPHLHDNDKKQQKSRAAANSPHFQQEGIASFMPPPFKATAGPIPQMKENEEEKAEALQKKQAQSEVEGEANNSFAAGGETPATPPNPNENILTTLQRKHNAYRTEPKQYKRYELPIQQKAVKQFKQVEPFQLKDSPAYQKNQGGLPQEVQAKMENSMGHDFSNVNIHKDSSNATDAGALAYAQGNDVHFAPGQFKPNTTSGQELIGHELAHVVQQREGRVKPTKVLGKGMAVNDDPGLEKEADDRGKKAAKMIAAKNTSIKSNTSSSGSIVQKQNKNIADDAEKMYDAMWGLGCDDQEILEVLTGKSVESLKAIRNSYNGKYGEILEEELKDQMNAKNFKTAMSYLLPALSLMSRLKLEKGFWDDNEEAMVEVIKTASREDVDVAKLDKGFKDFLEGELGNRQYYEVAKIVWPDKKYEHVTKLLRDSEGFFYDDEEAVFMAIMELSPNDRNMLWSNNRKKMDYFSGYETDESKISTDSTYGRLRTMCMGNEADALEASLDIATDGLGTYDDLAAKVVESTSVAANNEAALKKILADSTSSEEQRIVAAEELKRLGGIEDNLLTVNRRYGQVKGDSFLGKLKGDISDAEYESYTAQMGVSSFEQAKEMIINAIGVFNDDEAKINSAFESLPPEMRQQLRDDPEVNTILSFYLNQSELATVERFKDNNTYEMALAKLENTKGFVTDFGKQLNIFLDMSEDDRILYKQSHARKIVTYRLYAKHSPVCKAILEVLDAGKLTTETAIQYATIGNGTDEKFILDSFERMNGEERLQFRIGYAMEAGMKVPETIMALEEQQVASTRYRNIMEMLVGDLATDDLEKSIDKLIGAPTAEEYIVEGGAELIMFILNQRVEDKGKTRDGSDGDNFTDAFSNTGGTSDVAEIAVRSKYIDALRDGQISDEEIGVMGYLEKEFGEKYQEHVQAADTVAEVASTIGAIAVAVVVTIVSGGTAAPAAATGLSSFLGGVSGTTIVTAAVAAGGTKVFIKEAIGEEHYDMGEEAATDFIVGGVDGAMTAMTAGFAKALQTTLFKSIGLQGGKLTSELTLGTLRATDMTLKNMGKQVGTSGLRGFIEGAIAGSAGELILTAMDEETWRQSIWNVITDFGLALLRGAAIGGGTGFAAGGAFEGLAFSVGKARLPRTIATLESAGLKANQIDKLTQDQARKLGNVFNLTLKGDRAEARKLLAELSGEIDSGTIKNLKRELKIFNTVEQAEKFAVNKFRNYIDPKLLAKTIKNSEKLEGKFGEIIERYKVALRGADPDEVAKILDELEVQKDYSDLFLTLNSRGFAIKELDAFSDKQILKIGNVDRLLQLNRIATAQQLLSELGTEIKVSDFLKSSYFKQYIHQSLKLSPKWDDFIVRYNAVAKSGNPEMITKLIKELNELLKEANLYRNLIRRGFSRVDLDRFTDQQLLKLTEIDTLLSKGNYNEAEILFDKFAKTIDADIGAKMKVSLFSDEITVYRAQGRPLLEVVDGKIIFASPRGTNNNGVVLHLNIGDEARAQEWINGKGRGSLVSFKIKRKFLDYVRNIAVSEHGPKHSRLNPWRVDVLAPDQYAIPPELFDMLSENIIDGSAKMLKK